MVRTLMCLLILLKFKEAVLYFFDILRTLKVKK